MLNDIVVKINEIVWSPALVILLIFAGLYFSFRTRFVQVRRFALMLKSLKGESTGKESRRGVSSFEAFSMALSGRVGTGNIVGVATAIALGGPGAVFWMWVVAFFGASTAFVESTLAQIYKFPHSSSHRGGPASYIEKGIGSRWLGILFAIFTILGCGLFLTTVQSNSVSSAMMSSYGTGYLISGIGLALILGCVIIGGVRSIAKVASFVTPFIALGYIVLSVIVLVANYSALPAVFSSIITNAFGINPICGGIIGSTIMMGVKRGIFSNEAGQGGGAIVSACAEVRHPAVQGLAQAFSVYVDTLLVCTATALMILSTGTYNIFDAKTGEMLVSLAPELGDNYIAYTQAAVGTVFGELGKKFITVALIFFVFTTIMAYYFYAESSIMYIFKDVKNKKAEAASIWIFRVLILGSVVFGAVRETNIVWQLGDIGVGLMAWVNVIALLILCPKAIGALKDFEKKYKSNTPDIGFKASDIGVQDTMWDD